MRERRSPAAPRAPLPAPVRALAAALAVLLAVPLLSACGQRAAASWPSDPGAFVPPTAERAVGRTSSTGTLPDPEPVVPVVPSEDGYAQVYEDATMRVTWKESRDIFHILDKRNGYVWSTGIDAGYRTEDQMNKTFGAFANSFISIEYYDEQEVLNKVSSTQIETEGEIDLSTLSEVSPGVFELAVDTGADGFAVKARISFGDGSMKVSVDPATIVERSPVKTLAALYIAPFLGAVGGRRTVEDAETGAVRKEERMPGYDGYLFVPDGPGALIRFRTNPVPLSVYSQPVFGIDPGTIYKGEVANVTRVDPAQQCIPLYGVAIGRDQAAFAAYATEGAPNMEVFASPRGTTTQYHYVTGRFVLRRIYFKVLNQHGEGYDTFPEQAEPSPIAVTYDFLAGADADYVGMAEAYRESLLARGLLDGTVEAREMDAARIDVLMADVKKWVFGYLDVPMTTAGDLGAVLDDLGSAGVGPLSVNLYGWQRGGVNVADPGGTAFGPKTATRAQLLALAERLAADGGQLSLGQDYGSFTTAQAAPRTSAVMNVGVVYAFRKFWRLKPVFDETYYARPSSMANWLDRQSRRLAEDGFTGLTADGIASLLSSDWPDSGTVRRGQAQEVLVAALDRAKALGLTVDAKLANEYAFRSLSRLTDTPMFNSQYLIETDTVPVLPIVLSGSVALYSPYVNFSFYTKADLLRMIDYGVRPSFLVTGGTSDLLARTNSNDLYATGYGSQRALIRTVSALVDEALAPVSGERIVDRAVPAKDVALVTYANGVRILVNYGLSETTFEGRTVGPQDFAVLQGG